MISLLIVLLVAYTIAKGGQMFIRVGLEEELEQDRESEDRMIRYRAWLRGDGRSFGTSCIDETHSPMVLFNQKDPTRIDCVICSICTDTLPRTGKLSCSKCSFTTVDGYILEDLCDDHKEKVLS